MTGFSAMLMFLGLMQISYSLRDDVNVAVETGCTSALSQLDSGSQVLRCSSCPEHKKSKGGTIHLPKNGKECINFIDGLADLSNTFISVLNTNGIVGTDLHNWGERQTLSKPLGSSDACRLSQILHTFYHDLQNGVAEADDDSDPFSSAHDTIHWMRDVCNWFVKPGDFEAKFKQQVQPSFPKADVSQFKQQVMANEKGHLIRDAFIEAHTAHIAIIKNSVKQVQSLGNGIQGLWSLMTPFTFVTKTQYAEKQEEAMDSGNYGEILKFRVTDGEKLLNTCCVDGHPPHKVFNPMDHYRKVALQCPDVVKKGICN